MYSINGVSLHEGHAGWRVLRDGTNTQGGITNQLNRVPVPGRPGYTPAPHSYTEQVIVFRVRTPKARLEELLALCAAATTLTRTADPTKEAYVELASAMPSSDAPLDGMHDVTITLSAYQGVWRDVAYQPVLSDGTQAIGITTPVQTIYGLPGLSAPVFDMDVFIGGVFGQFTLRDSGGSFLKTTRAWPGTASNGILFVGATGQAFLSSASSPWVPVSDASQYVDVSGNGGFRFTPNLVSGDPGNRRVELSLTTLSQTSTTLRVRAKRAYRMN